MITSTFHRTKMSNFHQSLTNPFNNSWTVFFFSNMVQHNPFELNIIFKYFNLAFLWHEHVAADSICCLFLFSLCLGDLIDETCTSADHSKIPVCSYHSQFCQWYLFLHGKTLSGRFKCQLSLVVLRGNSVGSSSFMERSSNCDEDQQLCSTTVRILVQLIGQVTKHSSHKCEGFVMRAEYWPLN